MLHAQGTPTIPDQSQPVVELKPRQFEYRPKVYMGDLAPRYRYVPISAQDNPGNFKLKGSAQVMKTFQIPPGLLSLSRSYVTYKRRIHGEAKDTNVWSYESTIADFNWIDLRNQSGQQFAYIDNAAQFLQLQMLKKKRGDFQLADRINGLYPSGTVKAGNKRANGDDSALSYIEPRYYRSNDGKITDTIEVKVTAQSVRDAAGTGTVDVVSIANPPTAVPTVTGTAGDANVHNDFNAMFPLCELRNTIFELDTDVDFDENLLLRIQFNPMTKIGFKTSGAGQDPLNPAAGTVEELGHAEGVEISDLQLYVAYIDDPLLAAGAKQRTQTTGINITVPFVHAQRAECKSTGSIINWTLSRPDGNRLKDIMWAAYNAAESKNTLYEHDNRDRTDGGVTAPRKIVQFRELINAQPLQFQPVDCGKNIDWMLNKKHLEGLPYACLDVYKYNSFHISELVDTSAEDVYPDIESGRKLDTPQRYELQIVQKGVDDSVIYAWATTTRTLHIQTGPEGAKTGFLIAV